MIETKNFRKAIFVHRPNRFQAYVILDGRELMVHVPNTGRCREILLPGTTVVLRQETNPLRKTGYDLIGGYKGERFINIDSQVPNRVVYEALINGKINELSKYNIIEREKTFGNSRFDFRISNLSENYYLEVKGVTFEKDGRVMFPDAPTERGRKHLLELVEAKRKGIGAGVLFLVQMDGVDYFTPYDEMDKYFGEAVRYAYREGVDILSYDCTLGENFITLKAPVEIKL